MSLHHQEKHLPKHFLVIKARNDAKKINLVRERRQIDRTDALLGGFNVVDATELPLLESTGEKTRKTYDFTSELETKIC